MSSAVIQKNRELREKKAKAELWRRGKIEEFLLDTTQQDMVKQWKRSTSRKFVFLCSRRIGKTYTLCVLAIQQALASKVKIVYITAAYKDAKKIVQPLIAKILEDCPPGFKPHFKTQEGLYVFPNGSEIHLYGADKNPDGPRGQEAQFIIVDEAGFVNNLDYLISSVLMPMLLTTDGRMILSSTPPKSMDHPFMDIWRECEAHGNLTKKTIHDCPRVSDKLREEFAAEAGGVTSVNWRREYLLEAIADDENLVIPEFNDETAAQLVVAIDRPPQADRYVCMDLGFVDHTACVFAWWDFANARLVVEDELFVNKKNTSELAMAIKAKEANLWGPAAPYKRVADHNNPQIIWDLNSLHGLSFGLANKDAGKEPMINKLRLAIQSHQVAIHPRCAQLILQLKYCRWKGTGKDTFDRTPAFGHFDLVDALIMLWSSLNRTRMPTGIAPDVTRQHVPVRQAQESPLQTLTGRKAPSKIVRKWR